MLMTRLLSLLPSSRSLLTVAISGVVGAAVSFGVSQYLRTFEGPNPSPPAPVDRRFVALGRAYLPQLGNAYAAAWERGAKALDSGQGLSAAIEVVAQTWTVNRTDIFNKLLTPEQAKIVPESTKDADVTPAERAAMAAAWRGLALGLR